MVLPAICIMECFAPKPLIPMFLHPHKKGCRRCAYAHLRHPFRTLPAFGLGTLPGFPLPARTQLFEEGGQQSRAHIFQHAAGDTRRMVVRQCEEVHYGTTGTRLLVFRAKYHARNSRIDNCTGAHRAGLQCHIQRTLPQAPASQCTASPIDCLQLRMAKCIFPDLPPVSSARNHTILIDDHRPDGNLSFRSGLPGKFQGLPHECFVTIFQKKPSPAS